MCFYLMGRGIVEIGLGDDDDVYDGNDGFFFETSPLQFSCLYTLSKYQLSFLFLSWTQSLI